MSIFEILSKDYLHKKSVRIFNEANASFKQGNYSEALDKFLHSLKILEKANINQSQKDDLIVDCLFCISHVRGKMSQFELAELDLEKAIAIRPNDESLYAGLGSLKLDQNQFKEAIPYYEKVIEINSSNPDGYFFRGACKLELKRYHEAIPDFEMALKMESYLNDNEAHSSTLACLGGSYAGLNEFSKAIKYYDQAIAINDKNSSAFVNRGNCKIDLGLNAEACKDYYIALELGDTRVQENIDDYCKKQ
jgi:tetratricopeptide (TPR) repeat protein